MFHHFNANNKLLEETHEGEHLSLEEESDLFNLSSLYMLCALNNIPQRHRKLEAAKPYLKKREQALYQTYKDCQRILRKVKYN